MYTCDLPMSSSCCLVHHSPTSLSAIILESHSYMCLYKQVESEQLISTWIILSISYKRNWFCWKNLSSQIKFLHIYSSLDKKKHPQVQYILLFSLFLLIGSFLIAKQGIYFVLLGYLIDILYIICFSPRG